MPRWVIAVVLVAAAGAGGAALWWGSGTSASRAKARVVCGSCGHEFELRVSEYRDERGRPTAVCPKCGKRAIEPARAVCPHCKKAIGHGHLDPSAPAYARRLCPHCGKAVPAPNVSGRTPE